MSIEGNDDRVHGPDFGLLFRSLPGCYLALTSNLTIVAASDDYLATTKTTRDGIVGRNILEVLGSSSAMAASARVSCECVIREKIADAMQVLAHRVRRSDGEGFEERQWSALNTPVLGDDGEVRYILHRLQDLTDVARATTRTSEHPSLRRAVDRTLAELAARTEERYRQFSMRRPTP